MPRARRFGYLCIASGLAAVSVLACNTSSGHITPGGESCGQAAACEAGWLCVDGVCRELCSSDQDCTKAETCESGVCLPVADYECDEDADCDAPSGCQSVLGAECSAGKCHYALLAADSPCDDGNACTINDTCDAEGACGGEAMACDGPPADSCSQDDSVFREYASVGTCNPAQGRCEYAYEDTSCADCRHACLLVPRAPANLVAMAGDGQATLTWDGTDGALSYRVYVSETYGDTANAVPVSATSSPHEQTGLSNGTTYYFAVSAIAAAGEGDLSAEVSATPRISAPAQVGAAGGDAEVTLTWEPVPGADTYHLYWSLDQGVSSSSEVVSDVTSPFEHASRANGSTYYYALVAVDGSSRSLLSAEVSATPRISAPAQVAAAGGDQQATVTWEPVPGADTYDLYWDVEPNVNLASSNRATDVTSPFVHAPLSNGSTHYYALVAVDGPSVSVLSAVVSATAHIPAPANVRAASGDHQVTITWDPVPGADSYDLYWAESSGVTLDAAVVNDVSSPFVHEPLASSTRYYYALVAAVGPRESELSDEVSATTTIDTADILVADDAELGDRLGSSVALNGDYLILGAPLEDSGASQAGAAYVFHHGVSGWDAGIKLVASDPESGDLFGGAVALGGDYAIVGAANKDDPEGYPMELLGAVYVFRRADTGDWAEETKLAAPDPARGDYFGCSVAVSGDDAIAGAYGREVGDTDPLTDAGAAYAFHYDDQNGWDTGTELVAFDAEANDYFGRSVAISGNFAIVGADGEDGDAASPMSSAGAAYVFHHGVSGWDAGTKLVAPDAQAGDAFGCSVALSGDFAIVGARWEDGEGDQVDRAGAAYVFHFDGSSWDTGTKLVASDAQERDVFGYSVALIGDHAVVGASAEASLFDPTDRPGAAYLFHFDGSSWDAGTKLVAQDGQANDAFGHSVTLGAHFAVVGAPNEDGGDGDPMSSAGAAYVYEY